MADTTETESTKKKGGPKKLLVPVVLLAAGAFAGKTFLTSGAAPTPEQLAAEEAAAHAELVKTCDEANGIDHPDEPAEPGSEAPATTAGRGSDEHAAPRAAVLDDVVLISAGGGGGGADGLGPVLELEPMTLNLADGRYLKVGLGLQLPPGSDPTVFEEQGRGAKARDLALATLSTYTMDELVPPDARQRAKQDIGIDVCMSYHADVLTVYFTEFVMQ